MNDNPTPTWQKIVAVGYVLVMAALIVGFQSHLGPDFIPLDNSHVAPNILAEIVTVLVMTPVGVLVWPPTRRRLHRFADRKLAPLHEHIKRAEAHHKWMARRAMGHDEPHPHFEIEPPSRVRSPSE